MATVISPVTPEIAPPISPIPSAIPADWSLADVLERLGDIPPNRIRMVPPPGMATVKDVTETESRFERLCELVDGVLVEKTMGYFESAIAVRIIYLLSCFLEKCNLGIVLGEGGTLRVLPTQVRIPDVCFIAWEKSPGRRLPAEPIPALAPDLAIEVLSTSNTVREMERKLRDYFTAGVRLVWYIDPKTRTARVYTVADQGTLVEADGVLSGGDVLPGFELRMSDLFSHVEGQQPA
jgi:Uma2 family endonuclease